jgi:23S rRNA A2030 N6-methylase RlmJ
VINEETRRQIPQMANAHFGNIGDIWKHLPLASILAMERPAMYWESHSGAAKYVLSSSPERDYGIFYFLKNVSRSRTLRLSAYYRTLEDLENLNGTVPSYPGSPLLAMMLLRAYAGSFLFCDIDARSLESVMDCAAWLNIDSGRILCIGGDGVAAILDRLDKTPEEEILDTFIFIDPFDIAGGVQRGDAPITLFCNAARAGAKTALWYGFSSREERNRCWDNMLEGLHACHVDASGTTLWCGEICLKSMDRLPSGLDTGVGGCGVLTANLDTNVASVCAELGSELARIYERARFPSGHSGAFDFNTVSMW